MEPLDELERGKIHRFADWPNENVPRKPGVYSIWKDGSFIYVGMAGRGVPVAEVDEDGIAIPQKTKGLLGRLHTHASGKRSGDQFSIYICDRFVVPGLSADEMERLQAGANTLLDELTREYIREHLEYRYAPTPSGKAATDLENEVKLGHWSAGPPLLNPAKPTATRKGAKGSHGSG